MPVSPASQGRDDWMNLCKVVTVGPDMDPGVIAIASERGQGEKLGRPPGR